MAHSAQSYDSRRLFGRFWNTYLRHHWPKMLLAALFMVIEGSTLGALSWLIKPLFDKVFVDGQVNMLYLVGAAIFGLFLIRAITAVISRWMLAAVAQRTSAAMQVDLVRHMLTLDQSFFQKNPPGALIERVQGDTAALQDVWATFITGAGRDFVALVSLFAVAIAIDPFWTLATLIGAPLLIAPTAMAQRYLRRKTHQMRERASDRATRLDEIFHGIASVKLNRLEGYQMHRFSTLVDQIRVAVVKMTGIQGIVPALIDVVTGLGFFAVLVLGGQEIADGERTVGEFMSFFTAMALAFQPLRRLGGLAGMWQMAAASLERIYTVFDMKPEICSPAVPATPPMVMDVRLDDVWLNYGEKPVLRGLSLRAAAGKTTALVGPSGAGKTTTFNLLTRLIDPDRGTISVGGIQIQTLDLGVLRDMFSTVTQDATLFDETIRDNILLGRTDISDEQLRTALQVAHVNEFVDKMPLGLDSPAGPRGSALSGGQRQRVAIARAVLRNAPILLLDEATSALDTASEAKVAQALDQLSVGRTTLVIAHRLSTVRNADHIVVIADGHVAEEGTHEELLARSGTYAELCRLQLVE